MPCVRSHCHCWPPPVARIDDRWPTARGQRTLFTRGGTLLLGPTCLAVDDAIGAEEWPVANVESPDIRFVTMIARWVVT